MVLVGGYWKLIRFMEYGNCFGMLILIFIDILGVWLGIEVERLG